MSLKDEWQDTKQVFKQYKNDWKKEATQKIPAKRKKILIWIFSVLAIGIVVIAGIYIFIIPDVFR